MSSGSLVPSRGAWVEDTVSSRQSLCIGYRYFCNRFTDVVNLSIGVLKGICVSAKTVSLFHNHETLPCIISRNLQYSNMKEYKNLASFVVFFFCKVILKRTEVKSQFFRKQDFVLLSMDKQAIKVWLLIRH